MADEWTGDEMRLGSLDWDFLPELPPEAFTASGECNDEYAYLAADYHAARSAIAIMGGEVPAYTQKFLRADYDEVQARSVELRGKWVRAHLYRNFILRSLCRAAAAGELKTVIRPKGSGDEEVMERRFWKTDDYAKRFIPCSISPESPDDELAERTHWFFLEEAGLERLIGRMSHKDEPIPTELSGVHLSPFIQLMIEVAHVANIGPALQDQPKIEELREHILATNKRFKLSLSGADVSKMASFIREPELKGVGLRTARARWKDGGP